MGLFLLLEASQPCGTTYRLGLDASCIQNWFRWQPRSRGCSDEGGHLGKRVPFSVSLPQSFSAALIRNSRSVR
jgi:hypothetical protein